MANVISPALTPTEERILAFLQTATKPATGKELYASAAGCPVEYAGDARPHIMSLRRKGHDIRCRRGVGYWLEGVIPAPLSRYAQDHSSYRGQKGTITVATAPMVEAVDRMYEACRAEREAIHGTSACTERAS